METQCNGWQIEFHGLGARRVVGRFDGGRISSDGGSLLLREVEKRTHILKRLAGCFIDHRDGELIEHSVESLIKQRVYGMALGYEDLNDHDTLRHDALLGLLGEKEDPSGAGRRQAADRGKALAGKSTLNRLELTPEKADAGRRYKKIVADWEAMDKLLVELFLESYGVPPQEIVIDECDRWYRRHGLRRGVSSMAITVTIAICRCISSAEISCSVPVCGRPMRTRPRGVLRSLLESAAIRRA